MFIGVGVNAYLDAEDAATGIGEALLPLVFGVACIVVGIVMMRLAGDDRTAGQTNDPKAMEDAGLTDGVVSSTSNRASTEPQKTDFDKVLDFFDSAGTKTIKFVVIVILVVFIACVVVAALQSSDM